MAAGDDPELRARLERFLDARLGGPARVTRLERSTEGFSQETFSFDVEVLMMAQRRGYRIAEVPVNWTHQPGSKVNLVTDSARMLRDLFLIRRRYLSGEYRNPHLAPWPGPEADAEPASEPAERHDVALSTLQP